MKDTSTGTRRRKGRRRNRLTRRKSAPTTRARRGRGRRSGRGCRRAAAGRDDRRQRRAPQPRGRAPRLGRAGRSRLASSCGSPEAPHTRETPRLRGGRRTEGAAARHARSAAGRVVRRPLGWHAQRLGHLLYAAGSRGPYGAPHARPLAYTPPKLRRFARPRYSACHVDSEDARGNPCAQGLRSGLWLGHLPGGSAALPHRGAVRLAPPSWPRLGGRRPRRGATPRGAPLLPVYPGSASAGATALPPGRRALRAAPQGVLRRHVVERCIYGVDLDPLAVELCRLHCGSRRWTARCRSRSSTTRSSAATPSGGLV